MFVKAVYTNRCYWMSCAHPLHIVDCFTDARSAHQAQRAVTFPPQYQGLYLSCNRRKARLLNTEKKSLNNIAYFNTNTNHIKYIIFKKSSSVDKDGRH